MKNDKILSVHYKNGKIDILFVFDFCVDFRHNKLYIYKANGDDLNETSIKLDKLKCIQ